MKYIHQTTTTAVGQPASYGMDRGATWIEFDHGKNCRTAIYVTPAWVNGLNRIRALVANYGIHIKPEHQYLFAP